MFYASANLKFFSPKIFVKGEIQFIILRRKNFRKEKFNSVVGVFSFPEAVRNAQTFRDYRLVGKTDVECQRGWDFRGGVFGSRRRSYAFLHYGDTR